VRRVEGRCLAGPATIERGFAGEKGEKRSGGGGEEKSEEGKKGESRAGAASVALVSGKLRRED